MTERVMILLFVILVKIRNNIGGHGFKSAYGSGLSEYWDCRFESRSEHGYISVFSALSYDEPNNISTFGNN
jgi:hypothetical protein